MTKVRTAILGCGRVVQSVHLDILRALPNVEVVALADPNEASLSAAGERAPSAARFRDYGDALESTDVEAVVIALPTGLHGESASRAFRAGKHVYLEKPVATSRIEADEVLAAWRASGRIGVMGFNYRFHPLYQRLRTQLRSGRIGDLVSVRSSFCTPARALKSWKSARRTGGGVLLDLASHHIDLLGFFLDHPGVSVVAQLRSIRSEDDAATIQLTLSNGLVVQSFFSLSAVDEDRFEFYGLGGKLAVDRYRSLDVEFVDPGRGLSKPVRLFNAARRAASGRYAMRKLWSGGAEPSFRTSLAGFVSAVQGRPSMSPDLEHGYRSLAIVEAAEESARSGISVEIVG